jgi:hypothetical protein
MRRFLTEEALEQLKTLVIELRAIKHWDKEYFRHRCPEWYETLAYVSRKKRRSEIIGQLVRLSQ